MRPFAKAFTPVLLGAEIRRVEQSVMAQPGAPNLMARAGLAVAQRARELLGEHGKRVLILAGPGNNGGDAFVAARQLTQSWVDVGVVFAGSEAKLPADARAALADWRSAGGTLLAEIPASGKWHLLIDGLFGIGLERKLEGVYARQVHWANTSGLPVLAIDIPSGLHADTGRVLGCAIRATQTITFIALKPGLLTLDGPDHSGAVHFETLGLAPPEIPSPRGACIDSGALTAVLPARLRNTHKGSFGNAGILGGAPGMVGAALLAGRAALKLGVGRVFVGLFSDTPTVDPAQPELMLRPAQDLLNAKDLDCITIGPGLGSSQAARHALAAVIGRPFPLIFDADALNLIADQPGLQQQLAARSHATILTPHPAEAARLLATSTQEIQHDRIASARALAQRFNAAVVLKGCGSICALKNGDWYINTSGNPGMASAGMGDVLAGIIAALVAQGADPDMALLAGAHLHGLAADNLVERGIGPVGLTASEVIDAARQILNSRD